MKLQPVKWMTPQVVYDLAERCRGEHSIAISEMLRCRPEANPWMWTEIPKSCRDRPWFAALCRICEHRHTTDMLMVDPDEQQRNRLMARRSKPFDRVEVYTNDIVIPPERYTVWFGQCRGCRTCYYSAVSHRDEPVTMEWESTMVAADLLEENGFSEQADILRSLTVAMPSQA